MHYLDTNIIIGFLSANDPKKQAACSALFEQVEKGEISVVVPEMMIAEVVFVLSSPKIFNIPRREVTELVTPLLQLPHLAVQNRQILIRALRFYADTKGLDFPDAYIVATIEQTGNNLLFSFDQDYDSFPFIQREEPKYV